MMVMMTDLPQNRLPVHLNRPDIDLAKCKFRPRVECGCGCRTCTNAGAECRY